MELPHIGDQCFEKSCGQLDFLPVKCDGCKNKFCGQHWTYLGHSCPSPKLQDIQVPVCPLCDKPVPSKPGSVPDEAVSRHLDSDCGAKKQRNPRCSKVKCKTRELIKVDCNQCGNNFCLKHRHPQDHDCTGRPTKQVSDAGRAALARQNQPPQGIAKYFTRQQQSQPTQPRTRPNTNQLQGNLSEDEALARALQASMSEVTTQAAASSSAQAAPTSQEEQDRMLAMALAQSEQEARRQQQGATTTSGNSDKSCSIS